MDSKVKIKGDDFEFECDLKTITLDDRKELRVLFHKLNNKKYIEENGYFPVSVEIIQKSTVMPDDKVPSPMLIANANVSPSRKSCTTFAPDV